MKILELVGTLNTYALQIRVSSIFANAEDQTRLSKKLYDCRDTLQWVDRTKEAATVTEIALVETTLQEVTKEIEKCTKKDPK